MDVRIDGSRIAYNLTPHAIAYDSACLQNLPVCSCEKLDNLLNKFCRPTFRRSSGAVQDLNGAGHELLSVRHRTVSVHDC